VGAVIEADAQARTHQGEFEGYMDFDVMCEVLRDLAHDEVVAELGFEEAA